MIEARPVSEPVSKPTEPVVSIADELGKFAKLKEQRVITEEFSQLKANLMKGMR